MFDHDEDTKTATAPIELAHFSAREVILLSEAVAMAATAAMGGMLCSATFIPSIGAFVVTPGVAADEVLH